MPCGDAAPALLALISLADSDMPVGEGCPNSGFSCVSIPTRARSGSVSLSRALLTEVSPDVWCQIAGKLLTSGITYCLDAEAITMSLRQIEVVDGPWVEYG